MAESSVARSSRRRCSNARLSSRMRFNSKYFPNITVHVTKLLRARETVMIWPTRSVVLNTLKILTEAKTGIMAGSGIQVFGKKLLKRREGLCGSLRPLNGKRSGITSRRSKIISASRDASGMRSRPLHFFRFLWPSGNTRQLAAAKVVSPHPPCWKTFSTNSAKTSGRSLNFTHMPTTRLPFTARPSSHAA